MDRERGGGPSQLLNRDEKRRVLMELLRRQQHDTADDEIAIIGVSGRYPLADTLEEYWENLSSGRNCITEIPADRWDWRDHFDVDPMKIGKSYSKWGGFIKDADKFDPLFFNISPKEGEGLDPQERVFLETAWATLEDAAYTPKELARGDRKVGVFVGVMNSLYEFLSGEALSKRHITWAHSAHWSIANRVSYCFDFQGPSVAINTACSSSLTAIHMASESIRRGECHTAIAGGVNLILHSVHFHRLSKANMLASGDKCKSFGDGADGFVDGEGVGAVLLKPLRTAILDRDHIYAVIKGSSINSDGKTSGYHVPNPNAQANLILEVLARARVEPRTLSYFEAHGTGTSLGDPIEIAGLARAFGQHTQDRQFCSIGSVKSNIGHSESAAGIAGLTKVLMQMKHRQLVPSIHTEALNPHIDFDTSPFYVQRGLTEWKQPTVTEDGANRTYPRRAGLSSFGAGGANVHIILEEPQDSASLRNNAEGEGPQIIVLSAKNQERLKACARQMIAFLRREKANQGQTETGLSLTNLAYTLQMGREAMKERLAAVVSDTDELMQKLIQYCDGKTDIESLCAGTVEADGHEVEAPILEDAADVLAKPSMGHGDLTRLAKLWVSGAEADWKLLYSTYTPNRVSLPTYPFARERYWIREPDGQRYGETTRLHPLIDKVDLSLSLGQGVVLRKTLQDTDLILQDYRVKGQSVLPSVAYLEMACAAASQISNRQIENGCTIGLSHVSWLHPLVIVEHAKDVKIALAQEKDQFEYQIQSSNGTHIVTHGKGYIHVDVTPPEKIDERISIQEIKTRCRRQIDKQALHARFREAGITYGLYFQGLCQIWASDQEALGHLSLPAEFADQLNHYVLQPTLMDAALQTIGVLVEGEGDTGIHPVVPVAIEEVEIMHPFKTELYAYVRASNGDHFNVAIVDETGLVRLKLHDVTIAQGNGEMVIQAPASFVEQSRAQTGGTEHGPGGTATEDAHLGPTSRALGLDHHERSVSHQANTKKRRIREDVEATIVDSAASVLEIDKQQLDCELPFADMGIDSILAVRIANLINEILQTGLKPEYLINYPTIHRLADHICSEDGYAADYRDAADIDVSELFSRERVRKVANEEPGAGRRGTSGAISDNEIMDLLRRLEAGELEVDEVKQLVEGASDE